MQIKKLGGKLKPTSDLEPGRYNLQSLHDFAIGCENARTMAMLMTKCLALEGQIATTLPDEVSFSCLVDTTLDALLQAEADELLVYMVAAVEGGRLNAKAKAYTIDGKLAADSLILEFEDTLEWLVSCGFDDGDWFEEYREYLLQVYESAVAAIELQKAKFAKNPLVQDESIDDLKFKLLEVSNQYYDILRSDKVRHGKQDIDAILAPRKETSYLNTIGALLNLLTNDYGPGKRYTRFENQSAVISAIEDKYPKVPGLAKRTLEEKLSLAKRTLANN